MHACKVCGARGLKQHAAHSVRTAVVQCVGAIKCRPSNRALDRPQGLPFALNELDDFPSENICQTLVVACKMFLARID